MLDAGCGTGRVGRELARRGLDVVGVDIDPEMLDTARRKAPDVDWRLADLASVDLGRTFDAIVMAGNVMIFLEPGTEAAVVANMARHLAPGGVLIAGFQLMPGRLTLDEYDEMAAAAGLTLAERWATWDREAWVAGGEYAGTVWPASQAERLPSPTESWQKQVFFCARLSDGHSGASLCHFRSHVVIVSGSNASLIAGDFQTPSVTLDARADRGRQNLGLTTSGLCNHAVTFNRLVAEGGPNGNRDRHAGCSAEHSHQGADRSGCGRNSSRSSGCGRGSAPGIRS